MRSVQGCADIGCLPSSKPLTQEQASRLPLTFATRGSGRQPRSYTGKLAGIPAAGLGADCWWVGRSDKRIVSLCHRRKAWVAAPADRRMDRGTLSHRELDLPTFHHAILARGRNQRNKK